MSRALQNQLRNLSEKSSSPEFAWVHVALDNKNDTLVEILPALSSGIYRVYGFCLTGKKESGTWSVTLDGAPFATAVITDKVPFQLILNPSFVSTAGAVQAEKVKGDKGTTFLTLFYREFPS